MSSKNSPAVRNEKPFCRSNSPAVGLYRRFFKIILQKFIQQKKLRIPLKFVKSYRNELGDVAQLSLSDGRIWKIQVKKDEEDDHIWFENGFYEFSKHYSISHGFMLTFEYKGMSNFSVVIHDNSGCEIKYPPHKPRIRTRKRKSEFASQLNNPRIDSSRKKNGFECENEDKRRKIGDKSDDEKDCSDSGQESEIFVAANFDEMVSKLSPESKRAVNKAKTYKPKKHGFMVITRASDYSDRSRMDVPLAFVDKYNAKEIINVQISGGEKIL